MARRPRIIFVSVVPLLAALLVASATWLAAQYQVNTAPRVGGGQVNPAISRQVNVGLQGTPMTGSVHYAPTSVAMQSEVRNAYWQSGALPSDIRTGYASLGPITPGGAMDYIPPKESYMPKAATAPPAAMGSSAHATGSIRYAPTMSSTSLPFSSVGGAPVSSASLGARPISGAAPVSAGPINAGPINAGPRNTGVVRYAR